jgi:hypothetical protein
MEPRASSRAREVFQEEATKSLNPFLRAQLWQYLNTAGLGMLVEIEIDKGKWSEVVLGKDETEVLGSWSSQ